MSTPNSNGVGADADPPSQHDQFAWTTGGDAGITHVRVIDYGGTAEVHEVSKPTD
jgi:hypothetical protein